MVERLNPGQAASMPEIVGKPARKPRADAATSPVAANLPAAAGPRGAEGVRSLVKEMAAAPPVATERVAILRQQIEAGTYAVDPARLADAMIRSETGGR